jgi:hypothetical protein
MNYEYQWLYVQIAVWLNYIFGNELFTIPTCQQQQQSSHMLVCLQLHAHTWHTSLDLHWIPGIRSTLNPHQIQTLMLKIDGNNVVCLLGQCHSIDLHSSPTWWNISKSVNRKKVILVYLPIWWARSIFAHEKNYH